MNIIFCDFDGTLTEKDVGVALMEQFAPPQWQAWEQRWRRGEIATRENMEAQLNLIQAPSDVLLAWLRTQPMRAGAVEFVRECQRRGAPFHLLSDGLDFYIDPVLRANGLGDLPYFANRVSCCERGRWRIETPHAAPECGLHGCCKCALMERLDPGRRATRVYVGDAYSDLCPSRRADIVFARDVLADHCRRLGRRFEPFDALWDVMAVLWSQDAPASRLFP